MTSLKPIIPNSPEHAIVEDELRLLGRVSSALGELSAKTIGAPDFDSELVSLRDQIAESKPEDIPALVEQMTRLSAVAQRYGKGRDLPLDPQTPYFAHLRLSEDNRERDVLIGKRGFIDRDKAVQIVDWRNAPVSRIYYRYEEQDEYEEQFGDRLATGHVQVRRNITIKNGKICRIGCLQGTFVHTDDEQWLAGEPARAPVLRGGQGKAARPPILKQGGRRSRLGEKDGVALRADKHLPEIAALIDAKQFELITKSDSGLVVLQGGAGTGKTTVALHRVAYLTYDAPRRFRPERILVIVPSTAMARYVDGVLPSLGVRGVRTLTSRSWFQRMRHRALPRLPKRYNEDCPLAVSRFKKHPALLEMLQAHVEKQTASAATKVIQLADGNTALRFLRKIWHGSKNRPLVPRVRELRRELEHSRVGASERQQADVVLRQLLRRANDVVTDWSDVLTDRSLLAEATARLCPGEFTSRDLDTICRWCTQQSEELITDEGDGEKDLHTAADGISESATSARGRLDPIDDALLLFLCVLKRGHVIGAQGKPTTYEHVVVDEAQDLAAVELRVILRTAAPRYSVTIAGDTAQRVVFDNAFVDWETLLSRMNVPITGNATLTVGYRSTDEVMRLARSLLKDYPQLPDQNSARSGAPVELHSFGDEGEAVAMLAEALRTLMQHEPLASVALIARRSAIAGAYTDALRRADVPAIRWVRNQDFSFRPGIEVTDVMQVKGLEFDYVVLLDVNANNYPDTIENRHLLHIAATRAAHQLWIVSIGTPSPMLPNTL